jgi:hypothetical protein
MLATLLPGLRDLRTPLAVGYLWMIGLWLVLNHYLPESINQTNVPLSSMFELGVFLGTPVMLAAISFVAYLLGSMLTITYLLPAERFIQTTMFGSLVNLFGTGSTRSGASLGTSLRAQFHSLVMSRLREADDLTISPAQHADILQIEINTGTSAYRPSRTSAYRPWGVSETVDLAKTRELADVYVEEIIADLPAVGIQLQAINRDYWDSYDRTTAEAEFRTAIGPPLAVTIVVIAIQTTAWWLFLLVAPVYLFLLGRRQSARAASILGQAVVLKMVEPPVLGRLREEGVKNQTKKPPTANSNS